VVKPENGFTWRIYYCGEDPFSNETGSKTNFGKTLRIFNVEYFFPVACLESLYPKWERYFIHGRELKYIATDDGLMEDTKFQYRFKLNCFVMC